MASSRVPNHPTQASTLQPSDHSRKLSSMLDDLEQWVSIADNLTKDQFKKIAPLLYVKTVNIASLKKSTGTQKQQTDILERLAKLQRSKIFNIPAFGMRLDQLVSTRLSALCLANGNPDSVVADSSISAQSSVPCPSTRNQPTTSATASNTLYSYSKRKIVYTLVAATWTRNDHHVSPDDFFGNCSLTFNGSDITIVSETEFQHPDAVFSDEDVKDIHYDVESGALTVSLMSDGSWRLEFRQGEDAKAALSLLAF